jgi:hypothetical protein
VPPPKVLNLHSEGTAVIGILTAFDERKPVEPAVNPDAWTPPFIAEQNGLSVYAAYWQTRSGFIAVQNELSVYAAFWHAASGFFNLSPKATIVSIDIVRSGLP